MNVLTTDGDFSDDGIYHLALLLMAHLWPAVIEILILSKDFILGKHLGLQEFNLPAEPWNLGFQLIKSFLQRAVTSPESLLLDFPRKVEVHESVHVGLDLRLILLRQAEQFFPLPEAGICRSEVVRNLRC